MRREENNLYRIGVHSCDKVLAKDIVCGSIRQNAVLTIKMCGRFLLKGHLDVSIYFGAVQERSVP